MRQVNEFGEMARDWRAENIGITPVFRLEKMGERESGEPIFAEVVELHIAGDRLTSFCGPVDDKIKERFAAEYSSWKSGDSAPIDKTPLAGFADLTEKAVGELEARHIRYVEDLAGVSDQNIASVPGGRALRQKAIDFVSAHADGRKFREIEAANRAMKDQIAELTALVKGKGRGK